MFAKPELCVHKYTFSKCSAMMYYNIIPKLENVMAEHFENVICGQCYAY